MKLFYLNFFQIRKACLIRFCLFLVCCYLHFKIKITAHLGVKINKCLLPLDPHLPKKRFCFLFEPIFLNFYLNSEIDSSNPRDPAQIKVEIAMFELLDELMADIKLVMVIKVDINLI